MANRENDLIFEAYIKNINEDLGLGHGTPKMIMVPGPGSQNKAPEVVVMKISDEESCSDEESEYHNDELQVNGDEYIVKAQIDNNDIEITLLYKYNNKIDDHEEIDLGSISPVLRQNIEDAILKDGSSETEEETVYIQAGEPKESDCGDDCGCNKEDSSKGKTIYDGELDMARLELLKANEYAAKLFHHIGNHPESDYLEGWVASKITKAADYLSSVYHYLDYENNFPTREPCYSDEEEKDNDLELDDDDMTKTAKETGFGA